MPTKIDNKHGLKGEPKKIPKIPAREAKAQVMKVYRPASDVISHLYAETVIPGMKYEAIDGIRGALVDVTKTLKARDEAQSHWDKALADREKKEDAKNNLERNNDGGVESGKKTVDRAKLRRKAEEELREANRHLLAAVGKYQEREKKYNNSVGEVGQKIQNIKPMIMQQFGAEGYLDGKQDDENHEFVQFCDRFKEFFYQRQDTLADVKMVLGIVERACAALRDWKEVHHYEDIRGLIEALGAYSNWTTEAKEGIEIEKDVVHGVAASLHSFKKEAEGIKARGERRVASARKKLNGAMKEMNALCNT